MNLPGKLRYGTDRRWIVCDLENPDSLVHHIWAEFAAQILDFDKRRPEVWSFSERKMQIWAKPTRLLEQLRCMFWSRVYDARALRQKVTKVQVILGALDNDAWDAIMKVDANLAYFIRPVPRIEAGFEALMWRGLNRLREIVDSPVDFATLDYKHKRSYLVSVFTIVRECERRLFYRSHYSSDWERKKDRDEFLDQMEKEGFPINTEAPSAEPPEGEFDLEDLPAYDIFEGEDDGEGQDSGNRAHDESEEGSSGGRKEEEDL